MSARRCPVCGDPRPYALWRGSMEPPCPYGATTHEIAAVTGHRTLGMVQHYTESVDREKLAERAVNRKTQRPLK